MNLRYARNNIYVCDSAYKSRPNGMFLKVDLFCKSHKMSKNIPYYFDTCNITNIKYVSYVTFLEKKIIIKVMGRLSFGKFCILFIQSCNKICLYVGEMDRADEIVSLVKE